MDDPKDVAKNKSRERIRGKGKGKLRNGRRVIFNATVKTHSPKDKQRDMGGHLCHKCHKPGHRISKCPELHARLRKGGQAIFVVAKLPR
jgi:hypothetical protein